LGIAGASLAQATARDDGNICSVPFEIVN